MRIMRYLIDTHVFIWWMQDEGDLTKEASAVIRDIQNEVWLSVVVPWEIMIKKMTGKLSVPDNITEIIGLENFNLLPIQMNHMNRLNELPDFHSDPFDRIMIAQAIEENLILITRDKGILQYPFPTLLA